MHKMQGFLSLEEFDAAITKVRCSLALKYAARLVIEKGCRVKEVADFVGQSHQNISRVLCRAEEEHMKLNGLRRVTVYCPENSLISLQIQIQKLGGKTLEVSDPAFYSQQTKYKKST